jgi:hypothetical protein
MASSDEDHGRSWRPSVEDKGWSSIGRILGGWTVESSGDSVCSLYRVQGDEERKFLGLTSKPRSMVSHGLASKPVASGFPVWASKPTAAVA